MRPSSLAICLLFPTAMSAVGACGTDAPQPEAETVTVSASPAAQSGVTWKYLQTEYGDFLSRTCEFPKSAPDPRTDYSICTIQQSDGIASFKIDVLTLPASKARADVLSSIDQFTESRKAYFDNNCENPDENFTCLGEYAGLSQGFVDLGRIVKREAAK